MRAASNISQYMLRQDMKSTFVGFLRPGVFTQQLLKNKTYSQKPCFCLREDKETDRTNERLKIYIYLLDEIWCSYPQFWYGNWEFLAFLMGKTKHLLMVTTSIMLKLPTLHHTSVTFKSQVLRVEYLSVNDYVTQHQFVQIQTYSMLICILIASISFLIYLLQLKT